MKKLVTAGMTLVMVLSMGTAVFAGTPYSLTQLKAPTHSKAISGTEWCRQKGKAAACASHNGNYADANGDGICDYADTNGDGICDYADANGDGICDYAGNNGHECSVGICQQENRQHEEHQQGNGRAGEGRHASDDGEHRAGGGRHASDDGEHRAGGGRHASDDGEHRAGGNGHGSGNHRGGR